MMTRKQEEDLFRGVEMLKRIRVYARSFKDYSAILQLDEFARAALEGLERYTNEELKLSYAQQQLNRMRTYCESWKGVMSAQGQAVEQVREFVRYGLEG